MERLKSSLDYILHKLTGTRSLIGVLGLIAILSWVAVFANAESGQLKVYFFDVGQGDAIFIELPDGRQILIDGGPNDKVVEKLNQVMPFWDRSIDIVIATHADADHITGLVPVLGHYDVGAIIWNGAEAGKLANTNAQMSVFLNGRIGLPLFSTILGSENKSPVTNNPSLSVINKTNGSKLTRCFTGNWAPLVSAITSIKDSTVDTNCPSFLF